MLNNFLARLSQQPLLCDGAMGSLLYAHGLSYERCFEQLNLVQPELIQTLHLAYIAAGADVIQTHTFGANRYRLSTHSLSASVYSINQAGVRIAQAARTISQKDVFIAGGIGPLGYPVGHLEAIKPADAYAAFYEQAEALVVAGVDLLLLETFSDLTEICAALKAIQQIANHPPVVAMMTFNEHNKLCGGEEPALVAHILGAYGADLIGANCGSGPDSILAIIEKIRYSCPHPLLLAAQPNAGLPGSIDHQLLYPFTAADFAASIPPFLGAGTQLLGGCCGTTPAYIASMRKALDASK